MLRDQKVPPAAVLQSIPAADNAAQQGPQPSRSGLERKGKTLRACPGKRGRRGGVAVHAAKEQGVAPLYVPPLHVQTIHHQKQNAGQRPIKNSAKLHPPVSRFATAGRPIR